MTRDLGLSELQCLDQKADTYFIIAHEIQKPEPRTIGKGAEKQL
jgi:hypothetical protein